MKNKTTIILSIFIILTLAMQFILPITANAYELQKVTREESTIDVNLKRNGGDVFAHNIIIPRRKVKGGKTDDKAVVRIIEWPDGENKSPIGEVVRCSSR